MNSMNKSYKQIPHVLIDRDELEKSLINCSHCGSQHRRQGRILFMHPIINIQYLRKNVKNKPNKIKEEKQS